MQTLSVKVFTPGGRIYGYNFFVLGNEAEAVDKELVAKKQSQPPGKITALMMFKLHLANN